MGAGLLGFRGGGIMLYPSFHALFTAVLGWLGAVFVYLLLEQIINRMLAADLATGQSSSAPCGAMMRKRLHVAYGVLKSGQPFNPALHGC